MFFHINHDAEFYEIFPRRANSLDEFIELLDIETPWIILGEAMWHNKRNVSFDDLYGKYILNHL